ncbi:phage portal protein [Saccharopolyspora cebuensis]|uniref:phage portal protein n=1 Tax=Saccharopolyspora cebuensis TaxID=418759 RepID=UPI0031E68B32
MPLAADIAAASADLLFSEPPRLTVDNPRAQARLDDILNTPTIHSGLLEGAEVAAALGGVYPVYLRVVWDAELEAHAMLDPVDRRCPARHWRGVPDLAPLGRSDLDGVEPLLDALDETYSSWMRDVRLAKARLLVPVGYLQSQGPGQSASWDDDQEVFTELNMLTRGDAGAPITATQFAIRVQEHRETVEEIVRAILRTAGYSPPTFGDHDDGAPVTATEITARERSSERTRAKKSLYWAAGLSSISAALLDVDRTVFGTGATVTAPPVVKFPDRTQPDPEALARTAQLLHAGESASAEVRVRMVHPDWGEPEVAAEVQRILDETGRSVPDPAAFRGFAESGDTVDGLEPARGR